MLTLNDGRTELWQWDTGRKLTVDAECSQVHFSNKVFGRSIDVEVVDGVAVIPDILLQTDKEFTAWAFAGTPENGYTKISKTFKVNRRNKPADYAFTPPDQTTLGEILDRLEDLENKPSGDISEEDIQNAVNDYLDKNPVSIDEKDPTVPAWAKKATKPSYTAEEVGALPDTVAIPVVPSALPNPHKLTLNGAVQAEYDGSSAVTVTIPEGGPDGDYIPTPTTAEIGQTIVVKAVDESGKPTEWEAVDMPEGGGNDEWKLVSDVTSTEAASLVSATANDGLNDLLAYVLIPKIETDTGGTIYLNLVLQKNDGTTATSLVALPQKPTTKDTRYIIRADALGVGDVQIWSGSGASVGTKASAKEEDNLKVRDVFVNGGKLLGIQVFWNVNNTLPVGIHIQLWGR